MIVCANCKKEMKCKKIGMNVRFGHDGTHAYAADLYMCESCGNEIATTVASPTHHSNINLMNPEHIKHDIWMDK